jgi:hypothetical protein
MSAYISTAEVRQIQAIVSGRPVKKFFHVEVFADVEAGIKFFQNQGVRHQVIASDWVEALGFEALRVVRSESLPEWKANRYIGYTRDQGIRARLVEVES